MCEEKKRRGRGEKGEEEKASDIQDNKTMDKRQSEIEMKLK